MFPDMMKLYLLKGAGRDAAAIRRQVALHRVRLARARLPVAEQAHLQVQRVTVTSRAAEQRPVPRFWSSQAGLIDPAARDQQGRTVCQFDRVPSV